MWILDAGIDPTEKFCIEKGVAFSEEVFLAHRTAKTALIGVPVDFALKKLDLGGF